INRPSGPLPIGSVVWLGRSCMKGCDSSRKAAEADPQEKRKRAQVLARALCKLGYEVTIAPHKPSCGHGCSLSLREHFRTELSRFRANYAITRAAKPSGSLPRILRHHT